MIALKRRQKKDQDQWDWYWISQDTNRLISPIFCSQELAVNWANQHWDKKNNRLREQKPARWDGTERRKGLPDRRRGIDRRTEIRFTLDSNDRRKAVGRRDYDHDTWNDIFK